MKWLLLLKHSCLRSGVVHWKISDPIKGRGVDHSVIEALHLREVIQSTAFQVHNKVKDSSDSIATHTSLVRAEVWAVSWVKVLQEGDLLLPMKS